MMLNKVFNLQIKATDERKFTGYASTFGNKDRVGDIVMPGAFEKSLDKHKAAGSMPSLLLHHDTKRPIGVWESMTEDSKGLLGEARLTAGVRDADEAYALLKDGALHSLSIGYMIVNEEYSKSDEANLLNEVDLRETSLVTIPANAEAVITAVKDADGVPDVRELEHVLRDAGLSRREAKALLSKGIHAITPMADDDNAALIKELRSMTNSILNGKT